MGADFDCRYSSEQDVRRAFDEVVALCRSNSYEGYAGTLGVKADYVALDCEAETKAQAVWWAYEIDEEADASPGRRHPAHRNYVSDKWEPAGAIRVRDAGWVFFGWCSS